MKTIMLTNGGETIVDDDLYDYLNQWKWRRNRSGYVRRSTNIEGKRVEILLHRLINKTPEGYGTDHINRDKLDNRRENLRTDWNRQNNHNRSPQGGASKFKGVSSYKVFNGYKHYWYWRAVIYHLTKQIRLGNFPYTPEGELDAARAYDAKALELFGEFALTNKMLGLYDQLKQK